MRYLLVLICILFINSAHAAPPFVGGVAGGGGSTIYLQDSFSSGSTVGLGSHTPEVGGSWNVGNGVPSVYNTGVVKNTTTAADGIHYSATSSTFTDSEVTVKATLTNSGNTVGAALRIGADRSCYVGAISGSSAYIMQMNAGGGYNSTVATGSIPSFSLTTEYTLKFLAYKNYLRLQVYNGETLVCTIGGMDSTSPISYGYTGIYIDGSIAAISSIEAVTSNRFTDVMGTMVFDEGVINTFSDHIEASSFSSVTFTTTSNLAEIDVFKVGTSVNIQIIVDGTRVSVDSYFSNAGLNTKFVDLPGGFASKVVTVFNSQQSRQGTSPYTDVSGAYIQKIRCPNVTAVATPKTYTNRILLYGDSIASGAETSPYITKGWPMLVRNYYSPNSFAVEANGTRSLYNDAYNSSAAEAFVSKIESYSPNIIILAIGTNDYGLNMWSAASFGTAYADILDRIHTALPQAIVYCVTPIVRTNETTNGSGSTLGNYRTQISTAVSTRTSYASVIDGTAIMTTASLSDGVHPNDAGHVLYADYIKTALGL